MGEGSRLTEEECREERLFDALRSLRIAIPIGFEERFLAPDARSGPTPFVGRAVNHNDPHPLLRHDRRDFDGRRKR